jgi:uncharacterized membrane protein
LNQRLVIRAKETCVSGILIDHRNRATRPTPCGVRLSILRASLAGLVALLASQGSPAGAATIDWIGDAQGVAYPVVVSGNGEAVAFTSSSNALMRWTSGSGVLPLGGTGVANGMTHDGSLIVGQANGSPPGYFFAFISGGGSVGDLPLDNPTATHGQWATGISADGQRICGNEFLGSSTAQACEWDYTVPNVPPDSPQGYLFGGPADVANGISRDGSVIVGFSSVTETQGATVWNRTAPHMPTGRHDLAGLPGGDPLDVALAASGDGSLVVGSNASGAFETAWYWTWASGTVRMATLPDFGVRPMALDATGSRIVGNGTTSTLPMFYRAVIWDGLSAVPRLLSEVVESDHALSLGGAILLSATSISADGSTITGLGYRPGHASWEAYRLVLGGTTDVADGEPRVVPSRPALAIRPNPARGIAWVGLRVEDPAPATLELVDVTGRVCRSRSVARPATPEHREGIDLGGLPAGAYWVRLRQGDRVATAPVRVLR